MNQITTESKIGAAELVLQAGQREADLLRWRSRSEEGCMGIATSAVIGLSDGREIFVDTEAPGGPYRYTRSVPASLLYRSPSALALPWEARILRDEALILIAADLASCTFAPTEQAGIEELVEDIAAVAG